MSAPFSADARSSSHDFVRTLRSAPDPPVVGGLSKIEIAQKAWVNPSFYVPSKSEVIADWILTKFLKDKAKEIPMNPIFDVRYWQLLSSMFVPQDISSRSPVSRAEKTWLVALLHRVPLGPIVVAFLGLFQELDETQKEDLSNAVYSYLTIVWPIAVQRIATETLQECFGALLSTCSHSANSAGISKIGYTICNSYRTSLTNSSNKKKLCQTFVQFYLKAWILCVENLPDTLLRKAMLDAGVETLFNLDVLRQSLDLKAERPLLEKLQILVAEDRDVVLKVLPVLFSTYVDALKKNRGALFGQGSRPQPGSGLDELHNTALRFFFSISSLIDHTHQDHQAWAIRLALLQTIDHEYIFNRKHIGVQVAFDQIIELALVCLRMAREDNLDCCGVAIPCLSTIARIDYDLILPFIPRVLPLLLYVSIPSSAYLEFLDILLNYHVKTRTMGTFVQSLLSAVCDANFTALGCLKAYQLSFSSPVMHNLFLDRLSKALQNFLTETQCKATIVLLFNSSTAIWDSFNGNSQLETECSESPKKKRKTESTQNRNVDELAVAYSLICRLASAVLSSMPIQSLSPDALKSVKDSVLEFRTSFVTQAVLKSIKAVKKRVNKALWSSEITLAATLRLLYALNTSRNLSLPPYCDEKVAGKLVDLVANEGFLPELTLELFRTLFYFLSCGNQPAQEEVIEYFLQFLKKNFTSADIRWSGQSHHLTKGGSGGAKSALAVLHLVIERWLPEIDRLASADQLKKLLQVLISIDVSPRNWSRQQMEPGLLLAELLHSAQFWEFRNIRTAFLSLLDEMTASLASAHLRLLDSSSTTNKEVHVYRHLLLFPLEYLSWELLNDLSKRCISADMALGPLLSLKDLSIVKNLTVLRIFLKRVFAYCNSVSHDLALESSEFFIHLVIPSHGIYKNIYKETEFLKATMELAETYLAKLLKASKNNGPKAVLDVLASIKSDILSKPSDISPLAITSLVGLLTCEFPPSSLPAEIIVAIGQLHQDILSSLVPQLEFSSEMHFTSQDEIEKHSNIISGWHTLLCMQKWLAQSGNRAQDLKITGRKLTSHLVSWLKNVDQSLSQECEKLCVDVFAILLQELESLPEVEHPQQLDVMISVYIVFSHFLSAAGRKNIDAHLARMCRKLAVSDYIHALSIISDSMSSLEDVTSSHIQHLVDLASLVLREHPTHSLVHVQKFATRCLSIFDSHPVFVQGPQDLRLKVLDMISMHCSDHRAALRSADAAAIWLLLAKYLAPSGTHDNETHVSIFYKIVFIVGSLIRFRRDLVSHALPHLGAILRQLIFSLRGCRPNLGGKQTTLVMTSLPRWINAKHPLGAEEAKALGRLLETLTTKTVVRFLGSSSTETQKAESLAKPFSKHAVYVLEAYIESMNDPLCVLSLGTRKELEAGLFALCSMISEHSRDSLMISALDAGGRAVLKSLWKEYEKQRYVGKG